jgi:hypothetical protein
VVVGSSIDTIRGSLDVVHLAPDIEGTVLKTFPFVKVVLRVI